MIRSNGRYVVESKYVDVRPTLFCLDVGSTIIPTLARGDIEATAARRRLRPVPALPERRLLDLQTSTVFALEVLGGIIC